MPHTTDTIKQAVAEKRLSSRRETNGHVWIALDETLELLEQHTLDTLAEGVDEMEDIVTDDSRSALSKMFLFWDKEYFEYLAGIHVSLRDNATSINLRKAPLTESDLIRLRGYNVVILPCNEDERTKARILQRNQLARYGIVSVAKKPIPAQPGEGEVERAATKMMMDAWEQLGRPHLVQDPNYQGRHEIAGVDVRRLARVALSTLTTKE